MWLTPLSNQDIQWSMYYGKERLFYPQDLFTGSYVQIFFNIMLMVSRPNGKIPQINTDTSKHYTIMTTSTILTSLNDKMLLILLAQ